MVCDTPYLQNEFGDPRFFYVFNLILSFSTCSQSFKKKSVCGNFWARTSLRSLVIFVELDRAERYLLAPLKPTWTWVGHFTG